MSRRREAAELQRALAISTQDATRLSLLSPHQLSSSGSVSPSGIRSGGSGTQSSREMELRVADVAMGLGGASTGMTRSPQVAGSAGATVRPGDVMGPPPPSSHGASSSGGPSGQKASRSDHIISQGVAQTPSANGSSAINSFGTTRSTISVVVPASSARQSSASHNDASTSSSSHRPLFSPTQLTNTSRVGSTSASTDASSSRRDAKTINGRVEAAEELVSRPNELRLPDKPRGAHTDLQGQREPVESRTPSLKQAGAQPAATPTNNNTTSRSREDTHSRVSNERHHSPDPLDGLSGRSPRQANPPSSMSTATTDDGSGRRSSRVQQKKEDEEKAKALRRAKRAAEKAAKARQEQEEAGMRITPREVIVLDDDEEVERPVAPKLAVEVPRRTPQADAKKRRKSVDDDEEDDWDPKRKKKDKRKEKAKAVKETPKQPQVVISGRQISASGKPAKSSTPEGPAASAVSTKSTAKGLEGGRKSQTPFEADANDSATTASAPAFETPEPQLSHTITTESRSTEPTPAPSESEKENGSIASTSQTASKIGTPAPDALSRKRPLDKADTNRPSPTPAHRPSPGPMDSKGIPQAPGGIKWKTSRNDLGSVLSKFAPVRPAGMSKRLRIAPLHMTIGTPVKALPPVPKKPSKKKEDSDEEEEEEEQVDEKGNPVRKIKPGSKEWLMMED